MLIIVEALAVKWPPFLGEHVSHHLGMQLLMTSSTVTATIYTPYFPKYLPAWWGLRTA